ncbi:trafficking kinesin-binding protein 1-like isoform X2 [Actinia tenebrosa]|uniref:Trafficking kinesin-binding protein 1-like isoform X2 n=1 Tax=Actinia tenebrosa TaxID=6105 RepID=A0A6P8J8V8_ACTTE|nr:trafficking kinesin-binding protein 1-like isoform X2 [Actinia tenebrosa]
MCRYCLQNNLCRMSSISEEEDEDFPSSPSELVVEEKIFGCLPDGIQAAITRTLSSDRTNQMTKTHNDLDAILQLLQEKEKDLELAAKIGQSLLERNKSLMHKTETMEKYLSEHSDREEQLRHDIVRKNDLLQKFLKDQEDLLLEADNRSEDEAKSSESASLVRDDSFGTLQDKCHVLEQQNTRFILEALHLKEQTATEELKERQLVADCVQQLLDAKDQITALTDDIGRKAEDNIRQQEEISQLIDTVVDLQRRHTQLSEDNEELQSLLSTSQVGQDELKSQVFFFLCLKRYFLCVLLLYFFLLKITS